MSFTYPHEFNSDSICMEAEFRQRMELGSKLPKKKATLGLGKGSERPALTARKKLWRKVIAR
jgi:hypothetical protein